MQRLSGFGLRCQAYIFEIGRCVGISDMAARVLRSHNPMNVVKATVKALQMQRDPGMKFLFFQPPLLLLKPRPIHPRWMIGFGRLLIGLYSNWVVG